MKENNDNTMEKIVSLAKRRGFIFPGSEIYGGFAGTYDYGPLGALLRDNIVSSWKRKFVSGREDMYLVHADILMNSKVWQTSGHVEGFNDPLSECLKCKKRFRTDEGKEALKTCPSCGGALGKERQFNMMLSTSVGAIENDDAKTYLRPETAQGIFVNFKNVVDTMQPKLPFGIAQVGKAFRNEIAPRDFIFRKREFEQMEIEYFISPEEGEKQFEYWKDEVMEWMKETGFAMDKVHDVEISKEDRAHYSSRTVDFEFVYPFGQKELFGLAYRGDYDLKKHATASGERFEIDGYMPHVIEPTFGLDRAFLALLLSSYDEDTIGDSERTVLRFSPSIAPYLVSVSPLLKNKPELVEYARKIFIDLKQRFGRVMWDTNGNIGKRYRRQDEIGTPFCITVDFESLEDNSVTVRERDTATQKRISTESLISFLEEKEQG